MSEQQTPEYSLLVATPCYGGQMLRGYTQSILNLQRLCDQNGIKLEILTIGNESLITRARNFYVSLMLAKKEYTHMIFIDADISFNPLNVVRMLTSNKEVINNAEAAMKVAGSAIKEFELEKAKLATDYK